MLSSSDIPKFKRKSNEEQFKYNSKVICKLDEANENFDNLNIEKGKEKITEGKYMYFNCSMLKSLLDQNEAEHENRHILVFCLTDMLIKVIRF